MKLPYDDVHGDDDDDVHTCACLKKMKVYREL